MRGNPKKGRQIEMENETQRRTKFLPRSWVTKTDTYRLYLLIYIEGEGEQQKQCETYK